MTKRWKLDEIALACKAYISATNNPINGTDQDFHTFSLDIYFNGFASDGLRVVMKTNKGVRITSKNNINQF